MRNNKNIISYDVKNITLNLRNITSYFTEKAKIITLVSIIIMLSFINITLCSSSIFYNTNVSALSYSSNVGIGFTFNPSISISISPSNLVIDNLTPSITADSNAITVSVATNAAYGYTLSAMVNNNGNSGNGSNNNNSNSNLTHTNGTSVFSSIATDASLSSLTNDNTWGYSYRLSNNSNNNAWSNYSGLSNETSKALINTDNQATKPIDFKIAAKASETQPSGAYTGTINFTAVSKHIPVSLAEAYASEGKTMFNGYYTMQDMNSAICNKAEVTDAQLQVIDIRDKKVYWIAKLKDGHCWMTQNLDFDIQKDAQGNVATLTSELTDLVDGSLSGSYMNGYTYTPDPSNPDTSGVYNGLITWTPDNSTNKAYTLTSLADWENNNFEPYSYDAGQYYPDTNTTKENAGNHALSGNYYNWNSAIASNDTTTLSAYGADAVNSLCPKNWKLPTRNEYILLTNSYNLADFGIPYFIQSGQVESGGLGGKAGRYWTSTINNDIRSQFLNIQNGSANPNDTYQRYRGFSVRCLAR